MSDFLVPIGRAFGELLDPLRFSFDSAEDVELFALSHGWDARVDPVAVDAIRSAFGLVNLAEAVTDKLDVLINGSADGRLRAVRELIDASKSYVDRLDALGGVGPGGLPFPFDQNAFWTGVAVELVDELTITYLERYHPVFFGLLHVGGVIRFERQAPGGNGRVPYIRPTMHWDRLPRLFTGPGDLFEEMYQWNRPGQDFLHADFLRTLERSAMAFRVPATIDAPRPSLGALLNAAVVTARSINELEIPIVDGVSPSDRSYWRIGAAILPIPDPIGADAMPSGLLISPLLQGQVDLAVPVSRAIALHMMGAFETGTSIRMLIHPGKASVDANLADASFQARIQLEGDPEEPWVLIGSPTGARLELDGFLAMFGARGQVTDPEVLFALGTGEESHKLRLVVAVDEGDGFVKKLIGEGFKVEVGANLFWSSKHGVSFEGSAALELAKAIHLALGPIVIEMIYIQARLGSGNRLDVNLGVGARAELGPLVVVVENVGLRISLVPTSPGKRGAFGSLDVEMGFKPPNGVGLAVDAGAVKGGGYLYFDFDKEEYAGVLELVIAGFLTLTAVGLVTTRMPDGSKGFSLLIIITAEFGPGIQLGFGFTLVGVGGLLGLNRTVKLQPLADGVRTGAVNNIMFPKNVVANAPRIISDLRTIFPPFEGKFLIGPMAKLGWGSPPLITLSLGIIIEIPGNLAILGVLKCVLPDATAPVLVLQVAFVGAIEFDKKRLWLFAGIFDSQILTLTLEGEMGVLFAWGDDADFVLSVGGFHPRFTPPPLPFPSPKRLALCILDEDQARIRVSTYFAVTTNTVQFGAFAELFFSFSAISVEGHFQFDALFQFSPFYFIVELGASMSLKVGGMGVFSISLELALEGPTPWHARGRGTISFFFFEVSANFDETWGEEKDTTLPPIEVFPLLAEELAKEPNWSALPPKSGNLLVSLRVVGETKEFVLHPVGTLRITQRTVPLNSKIDLFGTQKPADANRFALAVNTPGLEVSNTVREEFAPAQFHAMNRNEKLAAPAFSQEDGGVDISATGDALRSSLVVRRIVRYEQIILDTNFRRFQKRFVNFAGSMFHHFLGGNAAARSSLSARLKNQMQPFQKTIKTRSEGFGVANTTHNTMVVGTAMFGSYHAAKEHMEHAIAQNPRLAGTMHVVPEFEIKRAA